MMVRRLINLYRFTRSEKRSIVLFFLLLIGLSSVNMIMRRDQSIRGISQFETRVAGDSTKPQNQQSGMIELNTADSSGLLKLYGIGPVFASRIIKYRGMLGGFYTPAQLLEVYGMDSVRYVGFIERIKVDVTVIRKLNINTSDFRDLLRHPYLDYEEVKSLVRYRDVHGPFRSSDILWRDSVLPLHKEDKLRPYFSVN